MNFDNVKKTDIEVYDAIMLEKGRQQSKIELIASENFASASWRRTVRR